MVGQTYTQLVNSFALSLVLLLVPAGLRCLLPTWSKQLVSRRQYYLAISDSNALEQSPSCVCLVRRPHNDVLFHLRCSGKSTNRGFLFLYLILLPLGLLQELGVGGSVSIQNWPLLTGDSRIVKLVLNTNGAIGRY